ncbi:phage major capsid protein [Alkalihalophilus marmarensis]|jgi:HK97 family phage major capsid protein|uniref:Capsid protein n=2 Tax=Alkalihalophilus TaxID=2893060 RepID=U6SQ63_9BACI|nr:phage major capsid protein [Alkalihalophilus marmarensis]ERN52791.1 capsid protein [Alkalihalophilus marmarensis DSM 21297]MCM3489085.1 phage major capsid protein [Alkalihalophilus marmarensis]
MNIPIQKEMMKSFLSLKSNKNVLAVRMIGTPGMTKREQELRQSVADYKAEAESLVEAGKDEEAQAKLVKAKSAKQDLDNFLVMQKDFEGLTVPEPQNKGNSLPQPQQTDQKPEYKSLFFKALRGHKLNDEEAEEMDKYYARLTASNGEDGGYIIPEDISTQINELVQTTDDLRQYVTVEPVSTNKGARTLERRADHTPLAPLSEYGDPNAMQEIASPKFDRLNYTIEDYAGFLPVANTVLADTDQSLTSYLVKWIAKKSRATGNHLILQVLNSFNKVDLGDYKGIKTTLNVTLDPAFAQEAIIITNQDGFNYLDQLYDGNGRPLLQPDPQDATRKLLFGRRIVVLSNKTKPSLNGKAPFIIGDLKEAVVYWDRQQMLLDMTKEGGQAWRTNTTEFRVIEREDVTKWDEEAIVYGEIDITNQPETIPEG